MESLTTALDKLSIYAPLEDSKIVPEDVVTSEHNGWAFRWVRLEPGQGSGPVRCDLINSHLGTMRGKYEALSYTWGETTRNTNIQLNGRPVQVTANLACALRHLRMPRESRLLWIDALCINQADSSEVNTYVQRMWAIYQNSQNVVVFLGQHRQESDQAFQLLFQLSVLPAEANKRHIKISRLLRDDQNSSHWNALERLMQRPWWKRAWIIQEYSVAPRVIFHCGMGCLDGDIFNQAMENLVDYRYNANIPDAWQQLVRKVALTPISHLLSTRKQYQSSSPEEMPTPLEILYRSRGSKASEPRDKVYSLFRLIAEDPRLQPDYSRSVHDLYKDVVRAIIDSTGTLEILSHHNSGNKGLPNMPTWCPDWTVIHGSRYLLQRKEFAAAGNTRAHANFHEETLTVKGRALDSIILITKGLRYNNSSQRSALHATVKRLWQLATEKEEFSGYKIPNVPSEFPETLVSLRSRRKGPEGSKTEVLDSGAVQEMWKYWCASRTSPFPLRGRGGDLVKKFQDAMHYALYGKSFFVSEQGRFGIVDATARVGDTVTLLLGGQVLFALRETRGASDSSPRVPGDRFKYSLVGEW